MSNPLTPYLPYIPEYMPYLNYTDAYGVGCGDLEAVLAEKDKDHNGCNICQWPTSSKSCLFNPNDDLYSIFQDYLRTNHAELFI